MTGKVSLRLLLAGLLWTGVVDADVLPEAHLLRVAYQGRVSDTEVSRGDVEVAVELWGKEVTGDLGYAVDAQVRFFDDIEQIVAAVERQELDVLAVSTNDYLRLHERTGIQPSFASVFGDSWQLYYILVARTEDGPASLRQAQDAVIVVEHPEKRSTLPTMWLHRLLADAGLARPDEFFSEVRVIERAQTAVLAVLFGQADVAIVSRRTFRTMAELNPQVARELTVLATSPGLLSAVTCIPEYVDADKRSAIIEGALRLHEYPKGRQILTLFGITRVIRFEEHFLESAARLARSANP